MKKAKYVLATAALLTGLLSTGAAISVSTTATAEESMPVGQKYYTPAEPQSWSEIGIAIAQANSRNRTEKLQNFLSSYGSPLAPYANNFIAAGDKYGIDYRVVVAIAGREQTFGVNWPGPSNNFWGYGGCRWPDIPTAIDDYSRRLSEEYPGLSRGDIYGSASRYAASSTWASGVEEFYAQLTRSCP